MLNSTSFRRVLVLACPQRTASGWVGLGAWFCVEVVYPSRNRHPPGYQPGLALSNYVYHDQRVITTLNRQSLMLTRTWDSRTDATRPQGQGLKVSRPRPSTWVPRPRPRTEVPRPRTRGHTRPTCNVNILLWKSKMTIITNFMYSAAKQT